MTFSTRLILTTLSFCFMLVFLPSSVFAADNDTGVVKGQINFCGKGGIAGLRIYVPGRQYFVILGDDGKFVFENMPAGDYELNYMLNGTVLKEKTPIFVFKQRESDLGEIALCDDPNFKPAPAPAAATDPGAITKTAPSSSTDVSGEGGCKEGNIVKLPNGSGECKNGKIILFSCNKKWSDCDGQVENGCETDIWTDNRNCGACNNECSGDETCVLARCS